MANTIQLKRSAVAGKVPTTANLSLGELGINTVDGRLFTKRNNGSDEIIEFLSTNSAHKTNVLAATTANIALTGAQTIDGVSVVALDRVLVKDQTTQSQNGIYIVSASAWSRATDCDTAADAAGASVTAMRGTTNGGRTFDTDFKATDTIGTTAMTWYRLLDAASIGVDVQAYDADTAAIAALAATSGILRKTAANTWTLDTPTQLTALLDAFSSTLKGLAPASGGGTTNFLRADGTWAAPAAGGVSLSGTNTWTAFNTFSADLSVGNGSGSPTLFINGATSGSRSIIFRTAGSNRWQVLADNSVESGSDVGSNFDINRYSDAGAFLDTPFTIIRGTGLARINLDPGSVFGNNSTANAYVVVNGVAGGQKMFNLQTAGLNRWLVGTSNAAETGSNAGASFDIYRYSDAGTFISTPFTISRATGITTIAELNLTTDLAVAQGGTGVGTLTGIVKGNGTSAFSAATANTDYVPAGLQGDWSTKGTIVDVVGMLAWKNFGNGHVIFDASNSTSPSGGAVGSTDAATPWTPSYPTLMGWNGTSTYGVRVDSARLADNSTLSNGKKFTVGTSAPGSPAVGDVWVDTN